MNGVIGTSLIFGGFLIFLYTILPSTAWIGLIVICIGFVVTVDVYRGKILENGLKRYLPTWMNEYLTRTDIMDELVARLRNNGLFSKFARLMSM